MGGVYGPGDDGLDDANAEPTDCPECAGDGDVVCEECDGFGMNEDGDVCSECNGNGAFECVNCDGAGVV